MKFKELSPLLHSDFEIYYKGQFIDRYNFISIDEHNISSSWILECDLVGIEVDEEKKIEIYLNN